MFYSCEYGIVQKYTISFLILSWLKYNKTYLSQHPSLLIYLFSYLFIFLVIMQRQKRPPNISRGRRARWPAADVTRHIDWSDNCQQLWRARPPGTSCF